MTDEHRPDPIDIAVGARIRVRRRTVGLSQSALGRHLGITFQQVQKYERGANRISASMLVKTAAKLGCSVSNLVGEDETVGVDAVVLSNLLMSGAHDLLVAYASIVDGRQRRALVELARSLAGAAVVDGPDDRRDAERDSRPVRRTA